MNIIKQLKDNTPRAWKYFEDYYQNDFENSIPLKKIPFVEYPFELQLGVFVAYFDKINSDIQFYSTDKEVLQSSVIEAFETYEEYLFLDS